MLEITKESQASPSLRAKLLKMRLKGVKISQMDFKLIVLIQNQLYGIEVFVYVLEDVLTSAMSKRKRWQSPGAC